MGKGNIAKESLINKIIENLGEFYLGVYDKKYYFAMPENGEKIQVAISMTCPKTPVEFSATNDAGGDWNFTDDTPKATPVAVSNAAPAEITESEKQNIADLMRRLGL